MYHAKSKYSIRNVNLSIMSTKIENGVGNLNGVDKDSLKVMFNASRVKVNFDDTVSIEDIEKAIQDLGYGVKRSRVKAA